AMSRASHWAAGILRVARLVRRATATTPWPSSISRATIAPPISPVAPVTKTCMRHLSRKPVGNGESLIAACGFALIGGAGVDQAGDEGGEIAAREQVTGNARGCRGGDVGVLVADEKAPLAVDRPVLHQIED